MFTNRDLELWQKTLSGNGITFEIKREDLEGLLQRLEAAEALINCACPIDQGCNCRYPFAFHYWHEAVGQSCKADKSSCLDKDVIWE